MTPAKICAALCLIGVWLTCGACGTTPTVKELCRDRYPSDDEAYSRCLLDETAYRLVGPRTVSTFDPNYKNP